MVDSGWGHRPMELLATVAMGESSGQRCHGQLALKQFCRPLCWRYQLLMSCSWWYPASLIVEMKKVRDFFQWKHRHCRTICSRTASVCIQFFTLVRSITNHWSETQPSRRKAHIDPFKTNLKPFTNQSKTIYRIRLKPATKPVSNHLLNQSKV